MTPHRYSTLHRAEDNATVLRFPPIVTGTGDAPAEPVETVWPLGLTIPAVLLLSGAAWSLVLAAPILLWRALS
jgi:hypothetical protein